MKLMLKVKQLLENRPELRDSDRALIWKIWEDQGLAQRNTIDKTDFLYKAHNCESIRRDRQTIQKKYPELRSSKRVQASKDQKAKNKGKFVFDEELQVYKQV